MVASTKNKGFTLIELAISVAVLGIFLSIVIPSYCYYVAASKVSRLKSYSTAMMGGARLAHGIHLANGLGPSDLLLAGDHLAVRGWPSKSYACSVVEQPNSIAPNATLSSSSWPVSCVNGTLRDATVSNPSACIATYHEAGANTPAYIDTSQISGEHCK